MDSSIIFIAIAIMTVLLLLIFAFAGPDPQKVSKQRLRAIHDRLMPSNEAVLAAQMRKTIAARLPSQEFGFIKLLPNPEKLTLRLRQTGKKWTLSNYLTANIGIAVVIAGLGLVQGAPILLSVLGGLALGFGIPHMVVGSMIGKRVAKFNARFPDAIDLLVRGLRSGLPIAETLHAVSTEIPGPVGVEFKQVIERVRIGKTMESALQDSADTLNTPEFQFFCITIAIQRDLSEVLRKRAQMKLKIKAMSSEAKASAYIIGALPFMVFALIWFMNPEYLAGFFVEETLIITGLGGLGWMSIGVFIMSQMINFEI